MIDLFVGGAVMRLSLERKVWGSNLGPVKSDTVLPTARQHYDISSKEAVLAGCNDVKMGPANSLHTSAYYSEYNERFDLSHSGSIFSIYIFIVLTGGAEFTVWQNCPT